MDLAQDGRFALACGTGFHTAIRQLGYKLDLTVEAMCHTSEEFFTMCDMLKFKVE